MKRILSLLAILALSVVFAATASAQDDGEGDSSGLRVPENAAGPSSERGPVSRSVDPRLASADGETKVVVQLSREPLAANVRANAARTGNLPSASAQRDYVQEIESGQDRFSGQAQNLGAEELARVQKALNAVVLSVDADQIAEVAALEGVESVRPVIDYELDLTETVPYIGGTAVQEEGFDGEGVNVAVLDSGVDYTHTNLGGEGTDAAYEVAYGTGPDDPNEPFTTRDDLFPTEKVYEGYDFVGEEWDGTAESPPTTEDDDPIDFEGHGTHVADIIAGENGVAPGAGVLAVKVCSAVGSSCEGVALLQGVDYALDPNGDGDISDAVDIINMSLGSSYGQKEDDLSEASANASRLGTLVVASAGNSADRPYIAGSPSVTPEVMSVAQTQVPSAEAIPLVINSPGDIAGEYPNTATLDFAPIPEEGITDDVVYVGQGCPAGTVPGQPEADPYLEDPADNIALIDRGGCDVSTKIDRAAEEGATGVLLANDAPGDAPSFSRGEGEEFVPTLVITQGDGQTIKDSLASGDTVNVTVSPENAIPLEGSVVASSSRGPSFSSDAIKPDIGAPGASVSAVAGSGDGTEAFSGTSGAAPMVAGAGALLVDAYPARTPTELKSLMMNTAETEIETNPATNPGELAPITRIGGGEVRVDRALDSTTAAYDAEENTGSLSFGYHSVAVKMTITKRVTVKNYGNSERTYDITPNFRYRNDARSGAVTIDAPDRITVPRQGQRIFDVRMTIDGNKLPKWNLDGGPNGGDGSLLQGVEFDGYINISDGTDDVHVAFHVLPHKSANVKTNRANVPLRQGKASVDLNNRNAAKIGEVEVFSLTGLSPEIPESELPEPGDSEAVIDLRAVGVRQATLDGERVIQFGVNTFGDRSHPNVPAEFDIYIDNDQDGEEDFIIFNGELGGSGITGQNVVNVVDVASEEVTPYFFTDADLNSANAILTAPMEAVGITPGQQFSFEVLAFDNYFTGEQTDAISTMRYTPNTPKFVSYGIPQAGIPKGRTDTLQIRTRPNGGKASPSQSGFLLLYPDGRLGFESSIIKVNPPNRGN